MSHEEIFGEERTITGRKPSQPNIQNIPIRTDLGDTTRKSFRRWLETPFTECAEEYWRE